MPEVADAATGYIAPTAANPGASLFGDAPNANGLPIYSLNTPLYFLSPEPGTLALVGLGGLTLWLFRRRK